MEKHIPVNVYYVYLYCPNCIDVQLTATFIDPVSPPQYMHNCPSCSYKVLKNKLYPTYKYVKQNSNKNNDNNDKNEEIELPKNRYLFVGQ